MSFDIALQSDVATAAQSWFSSHAGRVAGPLNQGRYVYEQRNR